MSILLNPAEHKAKTKQRAINVRWGFHGRMREDWWEQEDKEVEGREWPDCTVEIKEIVKE